MLITVVLPTHNRAGLVGRAVDSARRQTHRELEIVVIDDGSTDETPSLLARYAATDARVRVLRNASPAGPARARNQGSAAARGSVIAYLDDDDEWFDRKLEVQLAELLATDAGLVYGPYVDRAANGRERIRGDTAATGEAALRALARGNFIATPAVMVRRAVLEEAGGFDERMPMLEDWELWLRLSVRTRFAYVPEPLLRVHHSAVGITSRGAARAQACAQILATVERLAGEDRSVRADASYALGVELMQGGATAAGAAYLRRSVRQQAWPPRRVLMALLASLGAPAWRLAARAHARWRDGQARSTAFMVT